MTPTGDLQFLYPAVYVVPFVSCLISFCGQPELLDRLDIWDEDIEFLDSVVVRMRRMKV